MVAGVVSAPMEIHPETEAVVNYILSAILCGILTRTTLARQLKHAVIALRLRGLREMKTWPADLLVR